MIQRLRLAGAVEVSYVEAGDIGVDLDRVTAPSDGYIDNVHALRSTYQADLVSLITNTPGSPTCGVAWLMGGNNPAFAPYAFSVAERSCMTGYYSFCPAFLFLPGPTPTRSDTSGRATGR